MQAFLNGEYMDLADAKVSVMTHALNYGTGVFEGIRAYWDDDEEQLLLFRVREHFERMHQSGRILRIGIDYSVDELVEICVNVLRAGKFREDVYVRPLAFKSALQVGLNMVAMGPDGLRPIENGFTLFALPFGNYLDIEKPIRCTISAWRRVNDNMIPARGKVTGIYVNSSLAKTEALEAGFDEAIMLTHDGHVSEGSGENLFIVRHGKLLTPSLSEDILEGVTRSTVMQIALRRPGDRDHRAPDRPHRAVYRRRVVPGGDGRPNLTRAGSRRTHHWRRGDRSGDRGLAGSSTSTSCAAVSRSIVGGV